MVGNITHSKVLYYRVAQATTERYCERLRVGVLANGHLLAKICPE